MNVLIYSSGVELLTEERQSLFNTENIKKLEAVFGEHLKSEDSIPNAVIDVEISLSIMEKDGIAAINTVYRDIKEPTDVLSFPMWETEDASFLPPSDWDILPLGDIVVCPDVVEQNAKDNSKEFSEELILVISHGFLHLIGYDHATDEERDIMWKIQDALVKRFFDEHS